MREKSIYELDLHEYINIHHEDGTGLSISRVPSGWNYEYWSQGVVTSSHFVPYSSEFKGQSINTKIHAQAGAMYKLLREYVEMFENNDDADAYDHLYHKIIETLQKIES